MEVQIDAKNLRVIHEEFNEYILSDGNTLRCKDVLISFFTGEVKKIENDMVQVKIGVQFQPVGGISATANTDASKLEFLGTRQITDKDRISKLDFTLKKKVINIYETDGLLLLVKSSLQEVWSTGFKDVNGTPMYRFYTSAIMEVLNKDEIGTPRDGSKTISVKSST